jgi:long-chain acyl-CoA synthetase
VRLGILPLSHIYARTCDLYTWLCRGSQLVLAESRETLARDFQFARPTAFSGVPYLYQRIAESVQANTAVNVGEALQTFFGGRIDRLTCGGAPLPPSVESWYADAGLRINCGYGLTEAAPVITVTTAHSHRHGSVGKPLANLEMRLAADGEILVRGPNVMLGYWQDGAATAEAIRDSWLHTGDLGTLDHDGFLTIVGRKSEMIVLSTGKKVSPARVESLLVASPLIDQAAVFGEGRPALVTLIVPSARGLAVDSDEREATIAHEIDRCLAAAAREEQVHQFKLLDRPFSMNNGELTPKLSLCRARIAANFAAELETTSAVGPWSAGSNASSAAK